MTPEERWIIEGRTREALRESRKNLAALRADLSAHADKLKDASEHLLRTLDLPPQTGPTGMTPAQYFLHFFAAFAAPDIADKLTRLETEKTRFMTLEKQVKEFE